MNIACETPRKQRNGHQLAQKSKHIFLFSFFKRNSTKRQENSKTHTVKKLGIFSKIFGMQKVQLARIKGVYSKENSRN